MDGIKRVDRRMGAKNRAATAEHKQRVQKSSTLNRRYVKRPQAMHLVSDMKTVPVSKAQASANLVQAVAKVTQPKAAQARPAIVRQAASAKSASAVMKKGSAAKLVAKTSVKPVAKAAVKAVVKPAVKTVAKPAAQSVAKPAAKEAVKQAPKATIRTRSGMMSGKLMNRASGVKVLNKGAGVKLQPLAKKQEAKVAPVVAKAVARQATPAKPETVVRNQMAERAIQKKAAMASAPVQLSSKQIKDRAVQQAFNKMNAVDAEQRAMIEEESKSHKGFFRSKKMMIAGAMAVFSIAMLGYLVSVNMPDISVRVAAMQAGIERSYPNYVPVGFRLDGLVKEEGGRITMSFKNDQEKNFTLFEEKTAWDSSAVLTNYVKKNWGDDYSVARGQGLTIYIANSNAAWVNGGVLYVIENANGALSSSDLHDIAVSLY